MIDSLYQFSGVAVMGNLQRLIRVVPLMIVVSLLSTILPPPCLAETGTIGSSNPAIGNGQDTHFHIIQDATATDVIQVELRNPQRLPDGGVVADLYVNLKTYIAYGLTFEQTNTSAQWLANMPFQPLWRAPEPIYVGHVTFEPGGYLLIRQAKLGDRLEEQVYMISLDITLLVVYFVGADPPVDTLSGISAAFEAISIIESPLAIASGEIGALVTDVMRKADITTIALDIADLAQIHKVAEFISMLADELLHITVSRQRIAAVFNIFEWFRSGFRVGTAVGELLAAPSRAETKITLAPVPYEQPEFPILEPDEQTEIFFTLQNVGSEIWQAGHYALVNVNDMPLGSRPQMGLNVDVPSGQHVGWRFVITAPAVPGVYRTEWRFSYDGQLIGPLLWTDVIVIPSGDDNLADIIRSMIEEARRKAEEWLEEQWEELRRQIIEMIWAEIMRRYEESITELCGGAAATMLLSLSVLWLGYRRSRIGNIER